MKITNRKAHFEYFIIEEFVGGIQLLGSEVKSLRAGNASISESYIYINNGEVFLKSSFIAKYKDSSYLNHEEKRERKILLNKKEINKLIKEVKNVGITIIPVEIFLKGNLFKIKFGLARGKKLHDKRESIKDRDISRELRSFS